MLLFFNRNFHCDLFSADMCFVALNQQTGIVSCRVVLVTLTVGIVTCCRRFREPPMSPTRPSTCPVPREDRSLASVEASEAAPSGSQVHWWTILSPHVLFPAPRPSLPSPLHSPSSLPISKSWRLSQTLDTFFCLGKWSRQSLLCSLQNWQTPGKDG